MKKQLKRVTVLALLMSLHTFTNIKSYNIQHGIFHGRKIQGMIGEFPEDLGVVVREIARRMKISQLQREEDQAIDEESRKKAHDAKIEFAKQNPDIIDQEGYVYKFSKNGDEEELNILLLYGAPGNGKTTIARKIAEFTNSEFIEISGPSIVRKYAGEGPKYIQNKFAEVNQLVSEGKTVVILIDEIDAIAKEIESENCREYTNSLEELWRNIDAISADPRIAFICTTNNYKTLNRTFKDRVFAIEITNYSREDKMEFMEQFSATHNIELGDIKLVDEPYNVFNPMMNTVKPIEKDKIKTFILHKFSKSNISIRSLKRFLKLVKIYSRERELTETLLEELFERATKNDESDPITDIQVALSIVSLFAAFL